MATTIITKHGTTRPEDDDLVQGELAIDLEEKTLYSKDGDTIFKLVDGGGGSSGNFTDLIATNSFKSPGIDDNADPDGDVAITIDTYANVGIGTDSPPETLSVGHTAGTKLVVSDTGSFSSPSTVANFYGGGDYQCTIGATATFGVDIGRNATTGIIDFNCRQDSIDSFSWSQAGTERMRITSSGNVGIGTSSSGGGNSYLSSSNTMLKVKGSSANKIASLQLQSFGTANTSIFEAAAMDATQGAILGTMTNGPLSLQTNNSTRMTIDNTGSVGIGTTDPSGVAGGSDLAIYDAGGSRFGMWNGTRWWALRGDSGSDDLRVTLRGSNDTLDIDAVTIDSTGNVGIGTSNPATKLDVLGPTNSATYPYVATISDTAAYNVTNNGGGIGFAYKFDASGNFAAGPVIQGVKEDNNPGVYGSALRFLTRPHGKAPAEAVRITSAGSVGIGTSEPARVFHVESTVEPGIVTKRKGAPADSGTWQVGSDGNDNWRLRTLSDNFTSAAQAYQIDRSGITVTGHTFYTSGFPRLSIDNTGHVLVGRTSTGAAATDHGWQVYKSGIVYQYADAATSTDVHRWYNGAGSLVASINARGEGFFLGGATYSGPLNADEIIQDGAPVIDTLQIIRAFMKLRAATADPDSTVEELREKLSTAVNDIIDQFQDQIDNMPTPLED